MGQDASQNLARPAPARGAQAWAACVEEHSSHGSPVHPPTRELVVAEVHVTQSGKGAQVGRHRARQPVARQHQLLQAAQAAQLGRQRAVQVVVIEIEHTQGCGRAGKGEGGKRGWLAWSTGAAGRQRKSECPATS